MGRRLGQNKAEWIRPWVFVRLGFELTTSSSADRSSFNYILPNTLPRTHQILKAGKCITRRSSYFDAALVCKSKSPSITIRPKRGNKSLKNRRILWYIRLDCLHQDDTVRVLWRVPLVSTVSTVVFIIDFDGFHNQSPLLTMVSVNSGLTVNRTQVVTVIHPGFALIVLWTTGRWLVTM